MKLAELAAAFEAELIPVLCVGETLEEHAAGKTKEVVDRQIRAAFSLLPADMDIHERTLYIAYEPVWAISANQPAGTVPTSDSPEQTITTIRHLEGAVRGLPVAAKFIYGGSVGEENVVSFLMHPELSGALVGGASLRSKEFIKMIKFVSVQ
jgi:triosephosphate isomerase